MTIDEAISHAEEVAEGQDKCAEISVSEHAKERISKCASDHRQLAEWLTELKEAKRLLKAAVEDLEKIATVDECSFPYCDSRCPFECIGQCEGKHWKHLDEALKLIGDESNK